MIESLCCFRKGRLGFASPLVFFALFGILTQRPCHCQELPILAFKESTFNEFKYPNGILDQEYTQALQSRSEKLFKNARASRIACYVTQDEAHSVVAFYNRLSGQRFFKKGDRFIYTFSQMYGLPASRIEIYPIPIARLQKEFWPTRIDLVLIHSTVTTRVPSSLKRTLEDLKSKVGNLYFQGTLREDVAMLEMEEAGKGAEIFVVATNEPFESVYNFFRRKVGRIYLVNARDGDLKVRDFEVDATAALGLDREKQELYIRVEENPVVADMEGNSQHYLGYTFIQYTFWQNSDHAHSSN